MRAIADNWGEPVQGVPSLPFRTYARGKKLQMVVDPNKEDVAPAG
jgi:hypothetical protein